MNVIDWWAGFNVVSFSGCMCAVVRYGLRGPVGAVGLCQGRFLLHQLGMGEYCYVTCGLTCE